MSAFDELLRLIDLRCEVYHNHKLCGAWEVNEHELNQTCFHLVSHGQCELEYQGQTWSLARGDLILFPREQPHRMRPIIPAAMPMQRLAMDTPLSPDQTGLLCASVRFAHQASRALLDALPEMTLLRNDSQNQPWLVPLVDQIVRESQLPGPGQGAVLDHLAELMFMQALRRANTESEEKTGILRLHRHPQLSKALEAFHQAPAETWTLGALAQVAAMSRSRFASTFKAASGWTTAQYLTWWRMQLAWPLLARGQSVLATAQDVGYQSEAAFSRAFRKQFGQAAGKVRRSRGESVRTA